MEKLLARIKSPVVLTSMAALIFFVCKEWFGYTIHEFDKFIDLLLAVLMAFGVFNNPDNEGEF